MKRYLGVGLLFIAGVLAGSELVGRAQAQAQTQLVAAARYQYMCNTKMEGRVWDMQVQQYLNAQGAQGWRLMENRLINLAGNMNPDVYCFERRY